MSAIGGIVRFDGGPVEKSEAERMRRSLVIHGPDRNAIWMSPHGGLIHCLLSTAPQHAHERQPLVAATMALVANARLDNRDDLFAKFAMVPSANVADSVLIARAIEKYGADFARHVIGDFSCAAYFPDDRRLMLGTDNNGGRPLYYHWDGQTLRFASALKGLFACEHVPRALCEDGLTDWLLRNDVGTGATLYQGIQQVPPAHVLTVTADGPVLARYWDARDAPDIRFAKAEDYGEAFRALFDRVVASQSDADRPVGVMLSGGLDSQAIAATAAMALREQGKTLYSYTLVPDPSAKVPPPAHGIYYDERPRVEALVRMHPNIEPLFITPQGQDDLGFMEREFLVRDGPIRETPTYLQGHHAIFAAAAERGVRSLLNGGAGNHLISYDGHGVIRDLFNAGRWVEMLREARALATAKGDPFFRVLRANLLRDLAPWQLRDLARRRPKGPAWSRFSFLSADVLGDQASIERMRTRSNVKLFAGTLDERARRISRVCDRNAGYGTGVTAGSIEFRSPSRDRRIIEYCLGLPNHAYCQGGVDRRLLRVELADRMPSELCNASSRGMQNVDWIERSTRLRGAYQSALAAIERQPLSARLIDGERLARAVAGYDPHALAQSTTGWMTEMQGVQNTLAFVRFVDWFEGGNMR